MDKKTALALSGMTDKEIREMIQKTLTGDEPDYTEHLKRYTEANAAKVGQAVGCPYCGSEFIKRNAQHKFCCKEHRFAWHNERDPAKQQFLKQRNMKG